MSEITVSVVCITYNHQNYIREALDGFLSQKTDFSYEVIVHDDASTDATAKIIAEYEKKWPEIIRPIYQAENIYSRSIPYRTFVDSMIRGKYVAICEGDDYWCDVNKLQKQVDYMREHPECTLCIHNAKVIDASGNRIESISPVAYDRIVTTDEVILGDGGFCATNSIMTTADKYLSMPLNYKFDFAFQIYYASFGTTYCFSDELSVYRRFVPGSWTSRMRGQTEALISHLDYTVHQLEELDEVSEHKYHNAFVMAITRKEFGILLYKENYKELFKMPYLSVYKSLPLKKRITILLDRYAPWLHKKWLSNIRHIK